MFSLIALIAVASCIACVSAGATNTKLPVGASIPSQPNSTIQAPEFIVNMDLAPEERWTEIVTMYKSSAPLILDYFTGVLPPVVTALLEKIMGNIDGYLGEYGAEMRGVAKAYGLDLGVIVALNFAYELRKWGGDHQNITEQYYPKICTSIVTQDSTNRIFHGRNMDWNLPTNLRNLSVVIDFQRGNKTIYKGATYVGFVGIFTGMKPNVFSVSVNERSIGGDPIVDALNAIINGAISVTHALRDTLDKAYYYDNALVMLETVRLTAPVYYVMAGTQKDQGIVITRNRDITRDTWKLPSTTGQPWYLLQTNYDHWLADPVHDARRTYGDNHMNALGETAGATLDGIFAVLSQWPVYNNATCQTVMMQPSTGYFRAYGRYFY